MRQHSTHGTSAKRRPQFFIRRSEFAFDDRARYVEFICGIWNEGRFGPGSKSPFVIDLSDAVKIDSAFLDMTDDGMLPCPAPSPLGRAGCQVVEAAYRRAKQMGLMDTTPSANNTTAGLTPNLGRGSPWNRFSTESAR